MEPELTLAQFSFVFEAQGPIEMPELNDCMWHGVFGRALRAAVCIAPGSVCEECLLLKRCDYGYLFKGVRPDHAEMMRKYPSVPVPHIFHEDHHLPRHLRAGEGFTQRLILVGDAVERLPVVIRAMRDAGLTGFGKKRGAARLREVFQRVAPEERRPIMRDDRLAAVGEALLPSTPAMAERVRIRFLTPYIPSGKPDTAPGIDLPRFFMTLVRRVSMLQYFYTGKMLDADFKMLKETASQLAPARDDTTIHRGSGYSVRQRRSIPIRGITGSFDLKTEGLEALWPYLHLGGLLHLGKKASMGFGRYRLEGEDGELLS